MAFIDDPTKFNFTEKSALEYLGEFVPYPELYKNDYEVWELAMFDSYDTLPEDAIEDYNLTLSKQEFDTIHDALEGDNYAYFVRNFTTGDEEETRHEDDIDQSLEYFQETYDVNYKQSCAMKYLVDEVLKPSLGY